MRFVDLHIIHCSDSEMGDVKEIRTWHKNNGWRDVGYHFVIRRDGEIEIGRLLDEVGAHAKGFNLNSVGTCLIGKENFTTAQFTALKRLDHFLKNLFPSIKTKPHNVLTTAKTCPNFNVEEILND